MDHFFGLDKPAKVEDLILLETFHDPVSLSIAEELLTEGKIPFLKKERGAGGVVRLVAGFQTFGSDIFILPQDEEKAKELLLPLLNAEMILDGEADPENEEN
ncbi:MAG: DUF2007 domain-containing protein [Ruminococcaceae bacterium]|nr:DUF2007 domain-containing protein [Oscillospiraceae bacterium]